MLSASEPGVDTRSYAYSNFGELLNVTWTDSTTSTTKRLEYAYDALGRITSSAERENGVIVPDTTYAWRYDHVQDPSVLESTFVAGRLSATKSSIGDMHVSYDAFGRVDQRAFVGADAQLYREQTKHRFDGALSSLEFRLPDTGYAAESYSYDYDSASRLRSVKFHDGQNFKPLYTADNLDPFGRVRHATYGENITYEATRDETGRRLSRQETVFLAGQRRGVTHISYDAIGRELKREDQDGATNPITTNTYDVLGRLRTSTGGAPSFNVTASYDPLGNLRQLVDQVNNTQVSLTPDTLDRDRLCRIDYGAAQTGCNVNHDGSGNVVRQPMRDGNSRALTFFPSGAVRSILTTPERRSAVFRYDGSGAISTLEVKGPTDPRSDQRYGLIQRRNAVVDGVSQSILVRQIPGAGASRRGANGPFVFPFGEDRGTRFAASNDRGTFLQDVSYRPFGEASSTPSSPSSLYYTSDQWNGGDLLADLGVVHLGARIYDPVIGRFLSRDPLIIPRTASRTSPYSFAFNDPINASDPSGLDPVGDCASASGGACGSPSGGSSLGVALVGVAVGLATNWGSSSGPSGPTGPSLMSKDAYDISVAMLPATATNASFDWFASRQGFGSFDALLEGTAEGLGDAHDRVSSGPIVSTLFPIIPTTTLFLGGGQQLVGGIRDERSAARTGNVSAMSAAKNAQVIGLIKMGIAVASLAGPIAEVGAATRVGTIATRGPASGARIVSPPGPRQVLAGSLERPVFEGHGSTAAGSFTLPEGTWLEVPYRAGLEHAAAESAAMNGRYPAGFAILFGPGDQIPNLVLHPATTDMTVRFSSWQVTRPTLLRDILDSNMGLCVWAACR